MPGQDKNIAHYQQLSGYVVSGLDSGLVFCSQGRSAINKAEKRLSAISSGLMASLFPNRFFGNLVRQARVLQPEEGNFPAALASMS